MARLPEDLWAEILKRAEVGELLQCRGVCKSWRCVISSPHFIRTHFSFSFNNNNNTGNGNRSYFLFGQSYYALYDPPQDGHSTLRFDSLRFKPLPFRSKQPEEYILIDVIHGVVCLSQQTPYLTERFLLWNPAVHKHVDIPASFRSQIMPDGAGFGFDAINNDFKLVSIRCTYLPWQPKIEVFSALQGGRWRRLVADHIGPFYLLTTDHSCFLNGAIHWMLQSLACGKRELLVFDCEREEFRTMELPPELNQGQILRAKLLVTAPGKLAVRWGMFWWVMEEYGVASSWKKLTLDQISDLVDLQPGSPYFPPAHDHIKRSHRPINGHVFEPSMFLMDAKSLLLQNMFFCHV